MIISVPASGPRPRPAENGRGSQPDSLSCSGSGDATDAASRRRRPTLGDRHHDCQRLRGLRPGCRPLRPDGRAQPGLPRPSAYGGRGPGRAAAATVRQQRRRPRAAGRPRLRLGCLDPGAANATQARGVRASIVGVDASAGMLEQARAKSWPPGVSFEIGMAEELAFARESWGLGDRVPGVFAAYLFRNVTERDKVLAAVFDLLDDDGTFVVQEYSVAGSSLAAFGLVAGLLGGGHPAQLADLAADPALPLPVAQRAAVRLGPGLRRPALRRRVRRRGGAHGARLAARHPAHLPRPQAGGGAEP